MDHTEYLALQSLKIVLGVAIVLGVGYLLYDSFVTQTDEVNKLENYRRFIDDEVRYTLANEDSTIQIMAAQEPQKYSQLTREVDDKMLNMDTDKRRHKRALISIFVSDTTLRPMAKQLLLTYHKLDIHLAPFEHYDNAQIDIATQQELRFTKFDNYESSVIHFYTQEINSGVHFCVSLGLIPTCEADSTDLSHYSNQQR